MIAETPVPGRCWQLLPAAVGWDWLPIKHMDEYVIVTADGRGWKWREAPSWLPDERFQLRYTVEVRGAWVPWRKGDWALLAQDMGKPHFKEFIREAINAATQVRRRSLRRRENNACSVGTERDSRM